MMIDNKRGIIFTIPNRLTRLNEYINAERRNKYIGANIKRKETRLCSLYVPKLTIDYPVEITMVWTVKVMSNDLDNVSFGQKFILDAMVNKELLKNDNLTVVKKLTHEFIKGKDEKVTVIVREWEE